MKYSFPFKDGDKIIELGGGDNPLQAIDTVNVDIRDIPEVDLVRNLEEDFSDVGKFDGLYAGYVAEHISWRKIQQFFQSCFNVLNDWGVAVFVVPNTLEQIKKVVDKDFITLDDSLFIFGGQEHPNDSHKIAFSKSLIDHLLREAGFSNVKVIDHPDKQARDMIIEAYKRTEKKQKYDRAYFEDTSDGYTGYWDFPVHFILAESVADMEPKSVLDIGGAKGYLVKKLEAKGIRATCLDMSEHCWHTRATDSFVLHDATVAPWPFEDDEFDLAYSFAFLEHIEVKHLETVITEMARVSKRAFHNISLIHDPDDHDSTHCTFRPKEWWLETFEKYAPGYPVEITGKDWFDERLNQTVTIYTGHKRKLNIGCFMGMFHGWINADSGDLGAWAKKNGYDFIRADARKALQFNDNEIGAIISHHMIEHLTRKEGAKLLRECYQILEPGGVIRLSVPDTEGVTKDYVNGDIMKFAPVNIAIERATDDEDALFQILFREHETLYSAITLQKALEDAGFTEVREMPFNKSRSEGIQHETIDAFPTISVFVEGEKPRGLAQTAKQEELIYKYLRGEIKDGSQ